MDEPRTMGDIEMTVRTSKNGGAMQTHKEGGQFKKKKVYVVRTPALSGYTNKQGEQEGSYFASGRHEVIVEEGNPILEKVGNVVGYELAEEPGNILYDPEWAKGGANPSPFLGMTRVEKKWDEPAQEQRAMVENEQKIEQLRRQKEIEAVTGGDARVSRLEKELAQLRAQLPQTQTVPAPAKKRGRPAKITPTHVDSTERPDNSSQLQA